MAAETCPEDRNLGGRVPGSRTCSCSISRTAGSTSVSRNTGRRVRKLRRSRGGADRRRPDQMARVRGRRHPRGGSHVRRPAPLLCGLHSGDPRRGVGVLPAASREQGRRGLRRVGSRPRHPSSTPSSTAAQRTKLTWEKCRWALTQHGQVEIYRWLHRRWPGLNCSTSPTARKPGDDDPRRNARPISRWPNPASTPPQPSATRCQYAPNAPTKPLNGSNTRCLPRPGQKGRPPTTDDPGRPGTGSTATMQRPGVVPTLRTTPDDHPSHSPETDGKLVPSSRL